MSRDLAKVSLWLDLESQLSSQLLSSHQACGSFFILSFCKPCPYSLARSHRQDDNHSQSQRCEGVSQTVMYLNDQWFENVLTAYRLYENSLFTDVTLNLKGGRQLKAHKTVLTRCDFFRAALTGNFKVRDPIQLKRRAYRRLSIITGSSRKYNHLSRR